MYASLSVHSENTRRSLTKSELELSSQLRSQVVSCRGSHELPPLAASRATHLVLQPLHKLIHSLSLPRNFNSHDIHAHAVRFRPLRPAHHDPVRVMRDVVVQVRRQVWVNLPVNRRVSIVFRFEGTTYCERPLTCCLAEDERAPRELVPRRQQMARQEASNQAACSSGISYVCRGRPALTLGILESPELVDVCGRGGVEEKEERGEYLVRGQAGWLELGPWERFIEFDRPNLHRGGKRERTSSSVAFAEIGPPVCARPSSLFLSQTAAAGTPMRYC